MISDCSCFSWETLNHRHLLGRTYDQFGTLSGNRIAVVPRNFEMNTRIDGSSFATIDYALTGMAVVGMETPIMVDGINEKGLMGALLNFPGYAVYNTHPGKDYLQIHQAFLTCYILGKCANLEEVAQELSGINLTGERIFGEEMSVHYIFSDLTGESIIAEPGKSGIQIYRNTIGVLTNSPDYPWQKTNLRNYVPVTNLPAPPAQIAGETFACFGRDTSGGFGLPGDYSSPSRFVRLAVMKNAAVKGADELDGVSRMFHSFAVVDIPEGLLKRAREEENYHQTLCISAMCAESQTYYFSTTADRRISAVCLQKELQNEKIKLFELPQQQDIAYLH